ncbi:2-amino-4-hydroxy-6-hydroxymethyldihydropteridine diphosphokinase [Pseudohalocynthiibacter aestuariivivens]|nr:2-amino-4-hydroxy-6-hydroxymethyldihydropteridine diphosphokinase [Pseudohalocynthiibacter aestuariivivens]QIE46955.1 2-amino-4-hydroxy-6-hydroxymethyldihydropteridine diphosphokinase [Pseudohalocynthiibacter aestuariivivens]
MGLGSGFLIALGGNLPSSAGPPEQTLRDALAILGKWGCSVVCVSEFYQTPCFPQGAGPDYVNAAARIDYDGTPSELLAVLHRVEAEFGRERVQRWGRRTLDLDLIAVGDLVLPDALIFAHWHDLPPEDQICATPDQLIVPHPRLQDRAFVLVPLADIAPDWCHPVLRRTVSEMLNALPAQARGEVVALGSGRDSTLVNPDSSA